MNLSFMRAVDYWVGNPLCCLLTIIMHLEKLFFKRSSAYKKILFIQLSEMGSSILAYSAIQNLKKTYPDARLFFMIFKKNRFSVDILDIIKKEDVLTVDESVLFTFLCDICKNIYRLQKEKIDVVFDFELFPRISSVLSYLSGAPIRVGLFGYCTEGLYRGDLYTHKVQYGFQQHISKLFLVFTKLIGTAYKSDPTIDEKISDDQILCFNYKSLPKDIDKIWHKLQTINPNIDKSKKLIIFNPSAGLLPIRAWPTGNYIELAKKLLEDPLVYIILIGVELDRPINYKVFSILNNARCIDFTNRTTFFELIDLYNISDILVTNDSGPAHFASLTPIESFVFFGPETPKLYAPLGKHINIIYNNFLCSPCLTAFNHKNSACKDNRCLKAISVDEVYKMINDKKE